MIDQIEFANVIVLNKIDMVGKTDLERIRKTLQKLNPVAEVYATNYSKVPLSKVLNTHKFDFQEAAKSSGWLKELRGAEMVRRIWNFVIYLLPTKTICSTKNL